MKETADALRIDRWLFFTRFFKTRVLSSAAVTGGHVRVNGERASPGTKVKNGDTIELIKDRLPYRMTISGVPSRRGPAAEASGFFDEDEGVVAEREQQRKSLKQDRMLMPRTSGKPDKHTRRQLRQRGRGES